MANWRLSMVEIREIIRLIHEGKSQRKTAKLVGVSRDRVKHYCQLFQNCEELTIEKVKELTDEELQRVINRGSFEEKEQKNRIEKEFKNMELELKKAGVTREFLWEKYKQKEKENGRKHYSYSRFCHYFNQWQLTKDASIHLEHKVGEKLFVDFTGNKLQYFDMITQKMKEAECFVAILPATQLIYVEAVESQKVDDFVGATENSLLFIGGVPGVIIPDNLKSAVTKPHKYEPTLNLNFSYLGEHYETSIMPTRTYSPKDKAHVENAVKIIYRRIFAEIQDEVFYGIEDLNQAIREKTVALNNRSLTGRDYSRRELFEKLEKDVLRPLPQQKYELRYFHKGKVTKFYHIYLSKDKHYYSVPFLYIGKDVKLIYTRNSVEIYHNHVRIAYHKRDRTLNGYTTIKEHKPKDHQDLEWDVDRFLRWAEKFGENTKKYIETIFASKEYSGILYKKCWGILGLGKEEKYGKKRLEDACKRAILHQNYSYKTIENILSKGLDKLPETMEQHELPDHENIRGNYE